MSMEDRIRKLKQENEELKKENKKYRRLLEEHGLLKNPDSGERKRQLITERIRLFRQLFRGREDVFAKRFESREGRSGYTPVIDNQSRQYAVITDEIIYQHLAGAETIGLYPLTTSKGCYFLAADFDKQHARKEAYAFQQAAGKKGISCSLEFSRSGEGMHAWIFFSEEVPAKLARNLGAAILKEACSILNQTKLSSFDRFFPAQEEVKEKGLGNLIALPLQGERRKYGASVFVDENFRIIEDQWGYLGQVQKHSKKTVEHIIQNQEQCKKPSGEETVVAANGLFLPHSIVTEKLKETFVKMCSFHNPEYYKAKANRLSTDRIPQVIKGYEETENGYIFPRGKQKEIMEVLGRVKIKDERSYGRPLEVSFLAELFPEQQAALEALEAENCGVLSAGTGFGKTVVAAALVSRRRISTLILVHRTQLITQWKAKLTSFLNLEPDEIGQIGGGKNKTTGLIDIATIQSIRNKPELLQYGQVIVDECHHISAYTFEEILKNVPAAYVHGLTATPKRKDGLHPLMCMQCGPIIYKTDAKNEAAVRTFHHILKPRKTAFSTGSNENESLQNIYKRMMVDDKRNEKIFNDILEALDRGRSPLVLTERVTHLELLVEKLQPFAKNIIVLNGRLGKKETAGQMKKLEEIQPEEERLIIATGKYIGEGFDDPRLDTLFLTMPISWKGSIEQYVGRLHRSYKGKESVEVYDYVDDREETLKKMFEKRLKGYKRLGYLLEEEARIDQTQMKLF
jgi:superfamily II DNA or RNA helicase